MIIAQIQVRRKHGGLFLFEMPLLAMRLLLLSAALLLAPVLLIAGLALGMNPLRVLPALWRIFAAIKGTHIEFADCNRSVVVQIA
ncbi:MAG TPA: hypothetical protein VEV17_11990 [Bryobacteraceae bacterium]|nr:hypothetical protein [Bryobacteraceae bacterium]